jgi:hypothetical protein
MVLCPFVFLVCRPDVPPLRLQGAEVSSAHWVPLRALLAPSLRTVQQCDVSDRLAKTRGRLARRLLRLALGRMCFAAVRLLPAESTFDTFQAPDFLRLNYGTQPLVQTASARSPLPPETAADSRDDDAWSTNGSVADRLRVFLRRCAEKVLGWLGVATYDVDSANGGTLGLALGQAQALAQAPPPPLLLWGLTLGIVVDFAQLVAPQAAQGLWSYPTFSAPDVHFWLVLLSCAFRRRKLREVAQVGGGYSSGGIRRRGTGVEGEASERGEVAEATAGGQEARGEDAGRTTGHGEDAGVNLAALPTVPIAVDEGLDAVRPFFAHDPLREGKEPREGQRQSGRRLASSASPPPREPRRDEMSPAAPSEAHTLPTPEPRFSNTSLVGVMLEGYYDIVRKAVVAAILARLIVVGMGILGLCYLLFLRGVIRGLPCTAPGRSDCEIY